MSDYEQAVFISYAWGKNDEEHEAVVNRLDQSLKARGLTIIRDKRNLGYKGSIKEFMERIGRGNCVIVVISDKYLRSPNCMFELVEIAEGKQFHDRIFPIVLSNADIYDPIRRLQYVKHWEDKLAELDQAMRGVGQANLQGIREEIDQYSRIRDNVAGLISILKDMNTLTPDIHHDADFSHIYDAIQSRMEEAKSASASTRTSETRASLRSENTEDSGKSRTIGTTPSSSDEPRTIHLSKLKELETHQSSLRKYVEGYLLLSDRWDECGTAKSILLEKGISKIKARIPLDLRDLGEIRSSLSSAAINKLLPSMLMFDDFKNIADLFSQEMEGAKQEVEKFAKVFKTASPTKVEKMDLALNEALFHLDNSISAIKSLLEICGTNVRTEIGHIEGLINGIVHSQRVEELPTASEYSTTIDHVRTSPIERERTSQATGVIGRSSL